MDRIDEALNCVWENDSEELAETARAELAALRATVEAQARRLEEARELINQSLSDVQGITNMNDDKTIDQMLDHLSWSLAAWLATNAPQAEQEQAG